ncbi:hypothetical protein JHK87_012544 [Glycine soja]|nr:hypothetical protein JHK87_012544 [Glycine soja]
MVINEKSETLVKEEEEPLKNDLQVVKPSLSAGDERTEKLSRMKVATVIESCAGSGATTLELRGKLVDQMEWLQVSIGKLSDVTEMDLSENRLMALPTTIGGLKALTMLDLHSNQLINLPHSFGELINLVDLDLHANRLKSLPATFGNLTNIIDLDLSSNGSRPFPRQLGSLNALEILTLHNNRVKRLPSTTGNLCNLKELDVSFHKLEFVPESLCFATNLKKLNLGKNFADLRALPTSIGNLEMLEELDISDDQIKALPKSLRFLFKLRVFRADETPLEVPPRELIKLGAQEVVQYMADFVTKRDAKLVPSKKKKKGFWFWFCSIFCPQNRNKPKCCNATKILGTAISMSYFQRFEFHEKMDKN